MKVEGAFDDGNRSKSFAPRRVRGVPKSKVLI